MPDDPQDGFAVFGQDKVLQKGRSFANDRFTGVPKDLTKAATHIVERSF